MLSGAKVAALLMLFGAALASGEEVEGVTEGVDEPKQPDNQEPAKEGEGGKTQEKRGLFRVMGVHGENLQPYQFVYTMPQQSAAYQPSAVPQYEPRALGSIPPAALVKPYPMPYAQPTYQPQYVLNPPSAAPHMPLPYSSPHTMILLMMPPHQGNPYGSLMLLPYNNVVPQYSTNNMVPRVPYQFVPQYMPVPVKGYSQAPGFASAHFKASEYTQKPQQYLSEYSQKPQQYLSEYSQKPQQYLSEYSQKPQQYLSEYSQKPQQYLSEYSQKPQQYLSAQSYQEQPASSEEQETVTSPPNYVSRRPVEYVKS